MDSRFPNFMVPGFADSRLAAVAVAGCGWLAAAPVAAAPAGLNLEDPRNEVKSMRIPSV